MSTITIYKNRINVVGDLISSLINSGNSFDSKLNTIKTTLQGVSGNYSELQDAIDSIRSSSNGVQDKVENLKKLNRQVDDFIRLAVGKDKSAENVIKKKKEEFYSRFSYLKPKCEKAKSFFEKIGDWLSSTKDWCVNLFTEIREKGFFNVVGRFLHNLEDIKLWGDVTLRSLAKKALKFFYDIGVYDILKGFSKYGTYAATFFRKFPFMRKYLPLLALYGDVTEGFYKLMLNAEMDNNGVFHMRTDCWQQYAHYTTGYDDVFKLGVTEASGGKLSVDVHQSNIFWVDLDEDGVKDAGEEFVVWSWKGDYLNLGAGAETGIYRVMDGEKDPSTQEYTVKDEEYTYIYGEIDRDYSAKMTLDLYYDKNGDNFYDPEEKLYSYRPKEKQWWITGFDPKTQNVRADQLQAVTYIDFKSYGDKADMMYAAFKSANQDEHRKGAHWEISDEDKTATLVW